MVARIFFIILFSSKGEAEGRKNIRKVFSLLFASPFIKFKIKIQDLKKRYFYILYFYSKLN